MTTPLPQPFDYPEQAHKYRHGPGGYSSYSQFRPWVRDEYDFRCVYCLFRERWCPILKFHLDHFVAQAVDKSKKTAYRNLVYSCPACNTAKSAARIPNPMRALTRDSVTVNEDGTIECHTKQAQKIVRTLGLDSPEYNEWRRLMIGIIAMAAQTTTGKHKDLFKELMGYPENLPDLGRKNPTTNSRPKGIAESAFERKKRGELPDAY